jgi:hypothetical protein
MIDDIDDYIANLGPGDISAGNATQANSALREARSLWARASKGEVVEDLIERADIRASQFSGSGKENAIRTEFRNLVMNPRRLRVFTEAEKDVLRRVAKGGPVENALRMIGKLAPTGIVSGALSPALGAMIGGTVGAPTVGAATLPVTGFLARQAATAMTARNARIASEMMRSGGQIPPMPPPPIDYLLGGPAVGLVGSQREPGP